MIYKSIRTVAYLRRVFSALPAAASVAEIEALLPWNIDREELLRDLLR